LDLPKPVDIRWNYLFQAISGTDFEYVRSVGFGNLSCYKMAATTSNTQRSVGQKCLPSDLLKSGISLQKGCSQNQKSKDPLDFKFQAMADS